MNECHIENEDLAEECPYYCMGLCDIRNHERCPIEVEEEYKKFYKPTKREEVKELKYRTKTEKPVVVDAFLYTGNLSVPVLDKDFDEKTDAPEWIVRAFISGKLHCEHPEDGSEKQLYMDTPDGDILIPFDSYIIRSEDGEIFYLKAMYFDDTYEPAPPEVDQEQKRQEFEEAVKPIHDWLCKYGDPYTTVAVMQDRATVKQEYMTVPLPFPD